MHFRSTFNSIFIFQNIIYKINTITYFNFQGLFYAKWYSIENPVQNKELLHILILCIESSV